jgi:hypothetical protein
MEADKGLTPAQAYFFIHATHCRPLSTYFSIGLLRVLTEANTAVEFWNRAIGMLYDALDNAQAKPLLKEWLAEGINSQYRKIIQEIVSSSS